MQKSESRTYGAIFFQVLDQSVHYLLLLRVLDGHADMNLTGGNQIDDHAVTVKRPKNASEEPMRNALPVRIYVQDNDAFFDRDSCGKPFTVLVNHLQIVESIHGDRLGQEYFPRLGGVQVGVWINHSSQAPWIFHVLNSDWDLLADNLRMGLISIALLLVVPGDEYGITCSIVNGCTTSLP